MDMMVSLVILSDEKFDDYIKEIKKSNLPKEIQWDLRDLLQTAVEQTKQAKNMGWLP